MKIWYRIVGAKNEIVITIICHAWHVNLSPSLAGVAL